MPPPKNSAASATFASADFHIHIHIPNCRHHGCMAPAKRSVHQYLVALSNTITTPAPPLVLRSLIWVKLVPRQAGSEKMARKEGRAPLSAKKKKIFNIHTPADTANFSNFLHYPILSDVFGKITREFHRRGIFFRTALKKLIPRCWYSNQARRMA